MKIISQPYIAEMKKLKKLVQEMNRTADIFESHFWELGDLQRHVNISIEVARLRAKAEKYNELFYELAAKELTEAIYYIFSRNPNANTAQIIESVMNKWIEAKLITNMYEKTIIVNKVYGNK